MKKMVSWIALAISVIMVVVAACVTAGGSQVTATFWSLVPPIVAICLALLTKEVYSSLFVGIVIGAILGSGGSFTGTVDNVVSVGLIEAIKGTAGIFLFLVILGTIVALINYSGGSAAFGRWAQTHIKTRVGAQLATFVLGILIFIDDYFNCLTVGSVMLPVTDKHRISRAKLSYLIDATAAPICMIAPISSWAAAVAEYSKDTGMSGLALFIRAIPYNFYSLLTLAFVLLLIIMKADFGPMAKHEKNARENGDLFSNEERVEEKEDKFNHNGRVCDLVLPIVCLIAISVFALVYVGGFFGDDPEYAGHFINAFSNTDATVGLPWGALIALILIIGYLIARKLITFQGAMDCIPQGFCAMVPAILILTLATSLKNITNGLLGSADYVAALMEGSAGNFAYFLPAVIFIVACLLAFATGTSWGTFGILIPIVCSLFGADNEMLYIAMSACLAGAVCGDHCSPISDTTIMSSAGAKCMHIIHVSTQLPYALTVAGISLVCYLVAGLLQWLAPGLPSAVFACICLGIGVALIVSVLAAFKYVINTKKA